MRSNGSISLHTAKIRQQTKRFFLSRSPQESSLEKKDIHSIRSSSRRRGIEPSLRQISNTPLVSKEEEVEATREDMIEVEQASTYLFIESDPTNVATEESSNQLKSGLQEAISRISELEGSNEELKEARSKAENFLFEFKKHSDALGPESAETVERIA